MGTIILSKNPSINLNFLKEIGDLPQNLIVKCLEIVDIATLEALREGNILFPLARELVPIQVNICTGHSIAPMPTTVDERINISPDDFTRIPFLQNALVRLQITDVDLILFHNKIPEYVSKTKIVLYVTNNITAVPSFDYKIETVVVSIQKRTLYVPNDEFASFRRHLDLDKRLPEGVSTSENIRLFDIRDISCYKRRFPFLIQIHCLGNEIPVSSLRKLPEKLKFLLHNLKNSGYASLRITCHSFHEDFKN